MFQNVKLNIKQLKGLIWYIRIDLNKYKLTVYVRDGDLDPEYFWNRILNKYYP